MSPDILNKTSEVRYLNASFSQFGRNIQNRNERFIKSVRLIC